MIHKIPSYTFIYSIGFFAILVVLSSIYDGDVLGGVYLNLTRMPLLIFLSYFIFHFIGKFEKWNNLQKGFVITLVFVSSVLISRYIFAILVFPYHFQEDYTFNFFNWYRILSQGMIFISGIGGYGLLIYYSEKENWNKKQEELLAAKRQSELNFLKAQVQPHFLFNSLNGIYNEVIKKSEKASEMIIKLSAFMRFMLIEGKKDFIPVFKELEMVESYINLEQLRYGEKVQIEKEINDSCLNLMIPPLLLFSLIENSFKHGVSNSINSCFIKYSLFLENDMMVFALTNSIEENDGDSNIKENGIGLENIKRQLDIIFSDKYQLQQIKEQHQFTSILKIPCFEG